MELRTARERVGWVGRRSIGRREEGDKKAVTGARVDALSGLALVQSIHVKQPC
jgi:hypothetical protein